MGPLFVFQSTRIDMVVDTSIDIKTAPININWKINEIHISKCVSLSFYFNEVRTVEVKKQIETNVWVWQKHQ